MKRPELEERIVKLRKEGLSYRSIALALEGEASREQVRYILQTKSRRLTGRKAQRYVTAAEKRRIFDLREEGATLEEIAVKTGRSIKTVGILLNGAKPSCKQRRVGERVQKRDHTIMRMAGSGMKQDDIARRLGISQPEVSRSIAREKK